MVVKCLMPGWALTLAKTLNRNCSLALVSKYSIIACKLTEEFKIEVVALVKLL